MLPAATRQRHRAAQRAPRGSRGQELPCVTPNLLVSRRIMKECRPSRYSRRGTARQEDSSLDVFEAIRTVLAIRQYKDSPIPEETVRRIVEAGRLTASSQNKQPWHFIVVRERRTLQELAQLARSGPYIAEAAKADNVAVV